MRIKSLMRFKFLMRFKSLMRFKFPLRFKSLMRFKSLRVIPNEDNDQIHLISWQVLSQLLMSLHVKGYTLHIASSGQCFFTQCSLTSSLAYACFAPDRISCMKFSLTYLNSGKHTFTIGKHIRLKNIKQLYLRIMDIYS